MLEASLWGSVCNQLLEDTFLTEVVFWQSSWEQGSAAASPHHAVTHQVVEVQFPVAEGTMGQGEVGSAFPCVRCSRGAQLTPSPFFLVGAGALGTAAAAITMAPRLSQRTTSAQALRQHWTYGYFRFRFSTWL